MLEPLSELFEQPEFQAFLEKNQLDAAYLTSMQEHLGELFEGFINKRHDQDFSVVGINGCQGSGKSTLAEFIRLVLTAQGLQVVVLSIDDFYFSSAKREQLAKTIHPLLATRGVPGTHDVALALSVIEQLRGRSQRRVKLPRFDKSQDNPKPESQWDIVDEPVDIVILEGWCVGTEAEPLQRLMNPVNALESNEDRDGAWRTYVNDQLAQDYQQLFSLLDYLLMLKAPSFEQVFAWRLQQEHLLADQLEKSRVDPQATCLMSEKAIQRFVQFFERLTVWMLESLPEKSDLCLILDERRKITKVRTGKKLTLSEGSKALVFTDLDGTLLDHHSYSFQPALKAIRYLENKSIPVIFCSSKTAAEMLSLQIDIGIADPFIVENGAAIYFHSRHLHALRLDVETLEKVSVLDKVLYRVSFAKKRNEHQNLLVSLLRVNPIFEPLITPFSQLSAEGLADITGLSLEQSQLALQREFGEPIHFLGDESQQSQFVSLVNGLGGFVLEGGRFLHLSSEVDKGKALAYLTDCYQNALHREELGQALPANYQRITSIALGDSPNDEAMLNAADIGVKIQAEKEKAMHFTHSNILYTQTKGPVAWAEAIAQIFQCTDLMNDPF